MMWTLQFCKQTAVPLLQCTGTVLSRKEGRRRHMRQWYRVHNQRKPPAPPEVRFQQLQGRVLWIPSPDIFSTLLPLLGSWHPRLRAVSSVRKTCRKRRTLSLDDVAEPQAQCGKHASLPAATFRSL